MGEEYGPTLTIDDNTLYFVGLNREDGSASEDIYVSRRDRKTGDWTTARRVPELSNPYRNEAPTSISGDGRTMLLFVEGRMCFSVRTTRGWSEPRPLPQYLQLGNWQADAQLTADGSALLFAAGRLFDRRFAAAFRLIFVGILRVEQLALELLFARVVRSAPQNAKKPPSLSLGLDKLILPQKAEQQRNHYADLRQCAKQHSDLGHDDPSPCCIVVILSQDVPLVNQNATTNCVLFAPRLSHFVTSCRHEKSAVDFTAENDYTEAINGSFNRKG